MTEKKRKRKGEDRKDVQQMEGLVWRMSQSHSESVNKGQRKDMTVTCPCFVDDSNNEALIDIRKS